MQVHINIKSKPRESCGMYCVDLASSLFACRQEHRMSHLGTQMAVSCQNPEDKKMSEQGVGENKDAGPPATKWQQRLSL